MHKANELILDPSERTVFYEFYNQHKHGFWVMEEIPFMDDAKEWETKLTDAERRLISLILAFFAISDGLVSENIVLNLRNSTNRRDIQAFYDFQNVMENIHNETYNKILNMLIHDDAERNRLKTASLTQLCVKQKSDWITKWMIDKDKDLAHRVLAFVFVEGIFFSGSFCILFWLRKKNIMPGVIFSNELISKDEHLHVLFGIEYYKYLNCRISHKEVGSIISEAIQIEQDFFAECLMDPIEDLTKENMDIYIKYVADDLLQKLGYSKMFHVQNPFCWIENISYDIKSHFFETKSSFYRKPFVSTGVIQTHRDVETFVNDLTF